MKIRIENNGKLYMEKRTFDFLHKENLPTGTSFAIFAFSEEQMIDKKEWVKVMILDVKDENIV